MGKKFILFYYLFEVTVKCKDASLHVMLIIRPLRYIAHSFHVCFYFFIFHFFCVLLYDIHFRNNNNNRI